MIAPDTLNTPTPAIQAALITNTTLLLGLWASAGGDTFGNELVALRNAIETYKQPFVDLAVGVSVGSEDLYRISERGKKDMKPGADADTIVGYISRTRTVLMEAGGGLAKGVGVGHADTWGVWRDAPDVEKVVEAVDWVGMNTFPYWQAGDDNAPVNGRSLFDEAYSATKKAVGKKEVWVTETGFPVTGNRSGQAVPGREAAERYWKDVGCGALFRRVSTWWYTLQDDGSTGQEPSFGVLGRSGKEVFDLGCEWVERESGDERGDETNRGSSIEAFGPAATASAAEIPSSNPTANAAARW
ncbi:MAG: hypothetical protein LQ351_007103 [Letrouitia transgressa]|nr:MAG: hypothetical protein LQ351_007103 [Letrouitia transgressa]